MRPASASLALVLLVLLPTIAIAAPVQAQTEFTIWTDRPVYNIGEPVTVHIQPAPALGVQYWLEVWGPGGFETRSDLSPGQDSATFWDVTALPGQHLVELWGQVVAPDTQPQVFAGCQFEVAGGPRCQSDYDCPPGYMCSNGECVDRCSLMFCPEGTTCINGECVPIQQCNEGAVRNEVKCSDGVNWKQREVCRNNRWVPESQTCLVCSEGAVKVLETCPDGSWKQREVCRNNKWVPESQMCPAQPTGLEIRDAKLVQAVYDVPMIANKPTVVYLKLYSPSKLQTDITIRFRQTVVTDTRDVSPGENNYSIPGKGRYFVFETPGIYDVILEIRAQGGDQATPLASYTIHTDVVAIKGFKILFMPVGFKADQPSSAPDVTKYCAKEEESARYIQSPAEYIRSVLPVPVEGDIPLVIECSEQPLLFDGQPPLGLIDVVLLAIRLRQEAHNRGYDIGIGVVKEGAIEIGPLHLNGMGVPMVGAVIDDDPTNPVWTAAHELGHVFLLCHNDEIYCPNKDRQSQGFEVIKGQPVIDGVSLMLSKGLGRWITAQDYLYLKDEFALAEWLKDSSLVALQERGEKLYLHVYDSQGRHVGFSSSSATPEVQIPGASYLDAGNAIMITVPFDAGDIRIVVDASRATEAQENYTLLSVAAVGESASYVTSGETISSGETQEYSLNISGTTVTSIRRVTWWDRYQLWILFGAVLVVGGAGAGVYASRHSKDSSRLRRRKAGSRLASPRVKEIRSTARRPRVKSVQNTGAKPRVLRIEEE